MTIGNNVGIKMRLWGVNYTIHSAAHDKAKILMAFSFIFNAAGVNGAKVGVTSAASIGEGCTVLLSMCIYESLLSASRG